MIKWKWLYSCGSLSNSLRILVLEVLNYRVYVVRGCFVCGNSHGEKWVESVHLNFNWSFFSNNYRCHGLRNSTCFCFLCKPNLKIPFWQFMDRFWAPIINFQNVTGDSSVLYVKYGILDYDTLLFTRKKTLFNCKLRAFNFTRALVQLMCLIMCT